MVQHQGEYKIHPYIKPFVGANFMFALKIDNFIFEPCPRIANVKNQTGRYDCVRYK
jgi:hypothetical protein